MLSRAIRVRGRVPNRDVAASPPDWIACHAIASVAELVESEENQAALYKE
jgi:hypothetical protein